jgi:hypothetical protein
MRVITPTTALLSIAIATACQSDVEQSVSPTSPPAALAKAPPPPANPTTTVKLPLATIGLSIASDGLYSDGTHSAYTNGVCGVTASILASGSGDAIMQTNNPTAPDRKCAAAPRRWTLSYDDGVVETIPVFINLHELENATASIPVGVTAKRRFGINPTQNTRCDRLVWGESTGDSVLVTRTAANTWSVQSQAAPNDKAWCSTTGLAHHMPVQFLIVVQ